MILHDIAYVEGGGGTTMHKKESTASRATEIVIFGIVRVVKSLLT